MDGVNYIAYCDGAYSSVRNQGGIGIVIYNNDKIILKYNKGYKDTTNNRMEITAMFTVFKCLKNPIDKLTIVSDSQYVLGCATKGWKREKNKDLWDKYDIEYERVSKLCPNIEFKWEHGHKDCEGNNIADELAVQASQYEL